MFLTISLSNFQLWLNCHCINIVDIVRQQSTSNSLWLLHCLPRPTLLFEGWCTRVFVRLRQCEKVMSWCIRAKPSVSASQRLDSQRHRNVYIYIFLFITMFCNLWPRQHILSLHLMCVIGLQRLGCSHTSLTKMAQKTRQRTLHTDIREHLPTPCLCKCQEFSYNLWLYSLCQKHTSLFHLFFNIMHKQGVCYCK